MSSGAGNTVSASRGALGHVVHNSAGNTVSKRSWRRIGGLFDQVVEEPSPTVRRHLLDRLCRSSVTRAELERLLQADAAAIGFLEPREEPEHVGPYVLQRPLAEGGMGAVFLARRADGEPRRQVAVKILRRDRACDAAARRFRKERQILARLEHPNIARLYDVGNTEDGRPYLAMEHIDGEPIGLYCDKRQLPVAARLELVLQVCEAVACAHRHLLVHRDLKPSNILVDTEGIAKLLDFGIAKPLASPDPWLGTVTHTATEARAMTPAYASPEQVQGAPITTASDIYSLGVVLYELLAGCSPYRARHAPTHVLLAAVCEEEPRRPSTVAPPELRRALAGDLDNIVLKALAKDPERRYSTVDQLAEDLRRHLHHQPVSARPDTLLYRLVKLLRRRRTSVAWLAVCTALVLILAWTHVRQGERLERERRQAAETAEDLTSLLVVDPARSTASRAAAREALDLAASRFGMRLFDQDAKAALLDALGEVYLASGRGYTARELHGHALELRRAHGAVPMDFSTSLHNLGAAMVEIGELDSGEALLREALASRRELFEPGHVAIAETAEALAAVRWRRADPEEAEELYREALEIRAPLAAPARTRAADSLSRLVALHLEEGRLREAEQRAEEARQVRRELAPFSKDSRPEEARNLDDEAALRMARGDTLGAEELLRESLELRRGVLVEHASSGRGSLGGARRELVDSLHRLARCLGERGATAQVHGRADQAVAHLSEAEALYSEALAAMRELAEGDTPEIATLLNNLAVVLRRQGRIEAATTLFERVLILRHRFFGDAHPYVAQTLYSLGQARQMRGELDVAEGLYLQAEAILEDVAAPGHPAQAYPRLALAELWLDRGELTKAAPAVRASLEHLRATHPARHWRILEAEKVMRRIEV